MKILYFAWLRGKTGIGQEEIELGDGVTDIASLVDQLRARSPGHQAAFADLDAVRVAVNQDYVEWDHRVGPRDEIAFFPPVTGG
jgi:molybdopterin synthase sulfur carrier subunit